MGAKPDKSLGEDRVCSLAHIMPPELQCMIWHLLNKIEKPCQEIRFRVNHRVQIVWSDRTECLDYNVSQIDVLSVLERACHGSLYAYEEELRSGYLTIPGGHRIGFTGKAVLFDGKVQNMKYFSSLNIRIARQIPGVAKVILGLIWDRRAGLPMHTLIVSPPRAGKTTLLRDTARQLSYGSIDGCDTPIQVAVVDERSEIAGCYRGIPQLDVGPNTDVLDSCPKARGISMVLRSMSPDVIITDEIGRPEDVRAVDEALNAGVRLISTAHGGSFSDLSRRPGLQRLIEAGVFDRIIVLSRRNGPGTVETILDGKGNALQKG